MDFPLSDRDRERWEAVEAAYQRLIDADDYDVCLCWHYSAIDGGGCNVQSMEDLDEWIETCEAYDLGTPERCEGFDDSAAFFYQDDGVLYSAEHLRDTPMDADELAGEALQVGQEFEIDEITALLEAE